MSFVWNGDHIITFLQVKVIEKLIWRNGATKDESYMAIWELTGIRTLNLKTRLRVYIIHSQYQKFVQRTT